jgi:hypothetical protein
MKAEENAKSAIVHRVTGHFRAPRVVRDVRDVTFVDSNRFTTENTKSTEPTKKRVACVTDALYRFFQFFSACSVPGAFDIPRGMLSDFHPVLLRCLARKTIWPTW